MLMAESSHFDHFHFACLLTYDKRPSLIFRTILGHPKVCTWSKRIFWCFSGWCLSKFNQT